MAEIISGKIIKGIGGFYYIDAEDGHLYECKAKGIFRNKKIKPLVGDNVNIEILDPENNLGNIVEILPRFNSLIRPAVANVDQAFVIFAIFGIYTAYQALNLISENVCPITVWPLLSAVTVVFVVICVWLYMKKKKGQDVSADKG